MDKSWTEKIIHLLTFSGSVVKLTKRGRDEGVGGVDECMAGRCGVLKWAAVWMDGKGLL